MEKKLPFTSSEYKTWLDFQDLLVVGLGFASTLGNLILLSLILPVTQFEVSDEDLARGNKVSYEFNFAYRLTNCNPSKIRHYVSVQSKIHVDQLLFYSSIVFNCFNLVKKEKCSNSETSF